MSRRLLVVAGIACGVLATPAGAAVRITPPKAAPGAAVSVSGAGASATGLRVTIGGRNATIIEVARGRARVVVPNVRRGRARVVVKRRGRRAQRGRLTIPARFTGRIAATVDAARTSRATIGPDGGTIDARSRTGVRFTLTVPAGALPAATALTMTPLRRVRGSPLSGRATGVKLGPEGLAFAAPATLVIQLPRTTRGTFLGFGASDAGTSFELHRARRSGRRLETTVEHFTIRAITDAEAADIAAYLGPLVGSLGNLSEGRMEVLLRELGLWSELFGPDFCLNQPVCQQVIDAVIASLDTLIPQRCNVHFVTPSRAGVREMVRLGALYELASGDVHQGARDCAITIVSAQVAEAIVLSDADPLGSPGSLLDQVIPGQRAQHDLDQDMTITNFEWLNLVVIDASNVGGADDAVASGIAALSRGFDKIHTDGLDRCETAPSSGRQMLEKGRGYAGGIGDVARRDQFERAIDACQIAVTVSPSDVQVDLGAQQSFAAQVNSAFDPSVVWSASAGQIAQDGTYTAPNVAGTYIVRATSNANPKRSATATVRVACMNPSCLADVVVNERESEISSNASTFFALTEAGVTNDPEQTPFSGPGQFLANVSSSSSRNETGGSGSSASGTGTASQDSSYTTGTSGLTILAAGTVASTAAASGAGALGAGLGHSEMVVRFVVGSTDHQYELQGTRAVPAGDTGTITLEQTDAGSSTIFSIPSSGAVARTGTLEPGAYELTIEFEAVSQQGTGATDASSNGDFDLQLDVTR